jgi:hypothetical protein
MMRNTFGVEDRQTTSFSNSCPAAGLVGKAKQDERGEVVAPKLLNGHQFTARAEEPPSFWRRLEGRDASRDGGFTPIASAQG